jgi:hypothetical protein
MLKRMLDELAEAEKKYLEDQSSRNAERRQYRWRRSACPKRAG